MASRGILILDDDREAAETFVLMLRCHGFEARMAGDVDAGWAEVTREPPEAIILDLHLGKDDGVDFVKRLRAAPHLPAIPVAMITGDYLIDDRVTDDLQDLDARLYFKPLWEEDLIRIVGRLLNAACVTAPA